MKNTWTTTSSDLRETVVSTLLGAVAEALRVIEHAKKHHLPARAKRFWEVIQTYQKALKELGYELDLETGTVKDLYWDPTNGYPQVCSTCKTVGFWAWDQVQKRVICGECERPGPVGTLVTIPGKCGLCGRRASADEFCSGCKSYICGFCDKAESHVLENHTNPSRHGWADPDPSNGAIWTATVRLSFPAKVFPGLEDAKEALRNLLEDSVSYRVIDPLRVGLNQELD